MIITSLKQFFQKFSATQLTVLSFLIVSIIGAGLLLITEQNTDFKVQEPYLQSVEIVNNSTRETYPEEHTYINTNEEKGLSPIDAWFTSISALCVTGLTTIDFSQFSTEGQIVVMLMIQMGGLGIIVFTSIIALSIFRGLSERLPLRDLLANVVDSTTKDVIHMLKYVFAFTIISELLATFILALNFYINYGGSAIAGKNIIWWSLFHSISAFNNAGFALSSSNLSEFVTDPVINIVIGSLIIIGGLGYPVLIAINLFIRRRFFHDHNKVDKNLKHDLAGVASTVQIRVAIVGSVLLIVLGMIVLLIIDVNNPILEGLNPIQKIIAMWFQSVSTRTAGFNTIDIGSLHIASIFLILGLMFVGANPGGTAGGIKIPTVAVLIGYIIDWFKSPGKAVTISGRKISKFAVSHAIRLFFFSIILIGAVIFLISSIESQFLLTPDHNFNFEKIIFEVVSAFGTVGLSMGFDNAITSFSGILSDPSKLLLIITMFIGRIGPLTLLQSLPWRHPDAMTSISPDFENSDRIQIG